MDHSATQATTVRTETASVFEVNNISAELEKIEYITHFKQI